MNALAELIHCTGVGHLISCLIKCRKVSYKACNLAGNVYDLVYAVSQDLWKGFRVNAVSWRIQNDHVRFLRHFIQHFQHISGYKAAVADAISCCVFSGSFYRIFHNLHADHLAGNGRRKLGNSAGSTVKVKYYLISGSSYVCTHLGIQDLRRQGVWLEEGKRADLKLQPKKFFVEIILSIKDLRLITLYHIGQRII